MLPELCEGNSTTTSAASAFSQIIWLAHHVRGKLKAFIFQQNCNKVKKQLIYDELEIVKIPGVPLMHPLGNIHKGQRLLEETVELLVGLLRIAVLRQSYEYFDYLRSIWEEVAYTLITASSKSFSPPVILNASSPAMQELRYSSMAPLA